MLAEVMRHMLKRRQVEAAHVWRDAERTQAAEHNEAVRRIIDQAPEIPDPSGRRQ